MESKVNQNLAKHVHAVHYPNPDVLHTEGVVVVVTILLDGLQSFSLNRLLKVKESSCSSRPALNSIVVAEVGAALCRQHVFTQSRFTHSKQLLNLSPVLAVQLFERDTVMSVTVEVTSVEVDS